MDFPILLTGVDGAADLYNWFGYWPDFHDAEVVSLYLNRASESSLLVHTWEMTRQLDRRGCYVSTKHIVVEFLMEEILDLHLQKFDSQNVIFGLEIQKPDIGYRIVLGACHGVAGAIECKDLSIRLTTVAHMDLAPLVVPGPHDSNRSGPSPS
jgi:hypothetical protein